MSDKKVLHPIRGFFVLMKNLFLLGSVLITAFAIVGYFAGWIESKHSDSQEKATIEINTQKVKATAEDVVEKGKEFFGKASDKVEEVSDDVTENTSEKETDEAKSADGSESSTKPSPADTDP